MTRTLTPVARAAMSAGAKNRVITEETRQLQRAWLRTQGSSSLRLMWMTTVAGILGLTLERTPDRWKLYDGNTVVKVAKRANDIIQYLELEAGVNGIAVPPQPPVTKASMRPVTRPPRESGRGYIQLEVKASTRDAIKIRAKTAGLPMTKYLEYLFETDRTSDFEEGIDCRLLKCSF